MSRLDELPPDQRAALSLLLRQRKSYAEVASLLGISTVAVHDRAHAALAVLAPAQARGLTPEQRAEIGDYLLGQQPAVAERIRTRALLAGSEAGRAWALASAAELNDLADGALPEIPPADGAHSEQPSPGAQRETVDQLSSSAGGADAVHARPSSRLGGALVLAAIVAAVIVVVILVSGGGSGGKSNADGSKSSAATKTTTGPTPNAHFVLHSPSPKSRTVGAVEILSEGGKHAFYIEAQHVPASNGFFYALWLYNSHKSSEPLSKSPPVGKSHRLAGGALLPSNAASFREMLLTRETNNHPTHPGRVVLRGPFTLAN
jgi:sigma-70-like protein